MGQILVDNGDEHKKFVSSGLLVFDKSQIFIARFNDCCWFFVEFHCVSGDKGGSESFFDNYF